MRLRLILILLLGLFAVVTEARGQEVERDEAIRIKTTLVSVPVVASDRQGRYVAGLKIEDFALYQDGILQTISYFGAEQEPLNVALLLDTSRSTKDVLGKIKDAAREFIKLLQPEDRAMVVTFDFEVNALSPLTNDRKRLEKAIKNVEIGERVGTVMRDALVDAVVQNLAKANGRKAIILLTDGKDHGSYTTREALLDKLEESDVMVYSVYYATNLAAMLQRRPQRPGVGMGGRGRDGTGRGGGPNGRPGGPISPEGQRRANEAAVEYLVQVSGISAGRFYQSEVTDLKMTFEAMSGLFRNVP